MESGRTFAVVPIVALTHGAIAARGSSGYELVDPEHYGVDLDAWDGKPLFLGHPEVRGAAVMATPDVIDRDGLGFVRNARLDAAQRLVMDAWVDVLHAKLRAPALLERLRAQDPIDVSVGVNIDLDDAEGVIAGRAYSGAWTNIVPDHLALLPADVNGACSWDDGCGVRTASRARPYRSLPKDFWRRPACVAKPAVVPSTRAVADERFVATSAEWDLGEDEEDDEEE
jgi:hypothetical protein